MEYGTIKQEAAACKKAFRGVKVGSLVWFCHHGKPLEVLEEPAINRIKFILTAKRTEEKAIRLHWFRPVDMSKMPKWLQGARDAYIKACDAYHKACDAYRKAGDAYRKAWDAYHKAEDAYVKAEDAYVKAIHKHNINLLVKKHLPDCPWDGVSLVHEVSG